MDKKDQEDRGSSEDSLRVGSLPGRDRTPSTEHLAAVLSTLPKIKQKSVRPVRRNSLVKMNLTLSAKDKTDKVRISKEDARQLRVDLAAAARAIKAGKPVVGISDESDYQQVIAGRERASTEPIKRDSLSVPAGSGDVEESEFSVSEYEDSEFSVSEAGGDDATLNSFNQRVGDFEQLLKQGRLPRDRQASFMKTMAEMKQRLRAASEPPMANSSAAPSTDSAGVEADDVQDDLGTRDDSPLPGPPSIMRQLTINVEPPSPTPQGSVGAAAATPPPAEEAQEEDAAAEVLKNDVKEKSSADSAAAQTSGVEEDNGGLWGYITSTCLGYGVR